MVRAMRSNPSQAFEVLRGQLTNERIEHIVESIADTKDETVAQWARDVGLFALYDAQYRLFLAEIHSRPRSLERYLIMNDAGELTGIRFGPDPAETLRPALLEAVRILITVLSFLDKLFELRIADEINAVTTDLAQLDEQAG